MKSILIVAAIIIMSGLAILGINSLNTITDNISSEQVVEETSNNQIASYQGQELIQIPDGSLKQVLLEGFTYAKGLIIPGIVGLLLLGILGSTNFFTELVEHLKW